MLIMHNVQPNFRQKQYKEIIYAFISGLTFQCLPCYGVLMTLSHCKKKTTLLALLSFSNVIKQGHKD